MQDAVAVYVQNLPDSLELLIITATHFDPQSNGRLLSLLQNQQIFGRDGLNHDHLFEHSAEFSVDKGVLDYFAFNG